MIVDLAKVGREDPLSREKLCPVLGFFVEDGWERCCERAIELLKYGGLGHSLGIHSQDQYVIDRFFAEKPAFRIIVNSNVAIGAVGYTTGFAPAMTLGPGLVGRQHHVRQRHAAAPDQHQAPRRRDPTVRRSAAQGARPELRLSAAARSSRTPRPPAAPLPAGDVQRIVDQFLSRLPGVAPVTDAELDRLAELIARALLERASPRRAGTRSDVAPVAGASGAAGALASLPRLVGRRAGPG